MSHIEIETVYDKDRLKDILKNVICRVSPDISTVLELHSDGGIYLLKPDYMYHINISNHLELIELISGYLLEHGVKEQ